MHKTKTRSLLLDGREESLLLIKRESVSTVLVSILTLGKQEVIQPAALLKHTTQQGSLAPRRV